jgi:ABC-type nickel/cobalt efflux system permease component RcnA
LPDLGLKPSVLVGTAVATALLHTLIPDPWLPFVLIGRARNWSVTMTAAVSGVSAVIHALLSAILGAVAIAIGMGSAKALGESVGLASAVLLVVFGAAYAAWAWRKGGHFHPGGRLLHAESSEASCPGHESGSHPGHLHYHADGDLIHGPDRRGGIYLALIVGLNPCIVILPVMLSSVELGAGTLGLVTVVYAATTTVLMVCLAALGVAGARLLPVPDASRHMETASGLLIALTGVVLLALE